MTVANFGIVMGIVLGAVTTVTTSIVSIMTLMQARRNYAKTEETHVLVNGKNDALQARMVTAENRQDQLTNTITDGGLQVPPRPTP